jgi:hypothetical protein
MVPEACFLELGKSSGIIEDYFHSTDHTFYPYFGFDAASFPLDVILQDPILNRINQIFPIGGAGILRMDENKCYMWHVDKSRGVCVNMLIQGHDSSLTLFGSPTQGSQMDICRLEYSTNSLYLFNNQVPHTVINLSNTRYLFSVEFIDDKTQLSYNDVFGVV